MRCDELALEQRTHRAGLGLAERVGRRELAIAACNIVGWNTFKIHGMAHSPSGHAALIGYTMPMWSMLFSVWLLGEWLTVRRSAALVLGVAGVVVLLAATAVGMASATSGVVLMLASAVSALLGTPTSTYRRAGPTSSRSARIASG